MGLISTTLYKNSSGRKEAHIFNKSYRHNEFFQMCRWEDTLAGIIIDNKIFRSVKWWDSPNPDPDNGLEPLITCKDYNEALHYARIIFSITNEE